MAPAKPRQLSPFDPQALLDAQRRNLEAFTNAGEIVVDGMRTYAERQASMVQEAMTGFMGELQAGAVPSKRPAEPAEQVDRMRAAFEKVVAQVQELSDLLIKVQSEALGVLNACAMRNLESLGGAVPDFSDLQMRARAAFEAANRETTAVVDEMKKRMAALETKGRPAAAAASPGKAEPAPAPAARAKPKPPAAKPPARKPAAKPAAKPRARRGPAKPPA